MTEPTCENWHRDLALEIEGDLPPAALPALERHLAGCSACRTFRGELAGTQAALGTLRDAIPDEAVLERVRNRVMERVEAGRESRIARWTLPDRAPLRAAAALAVAAIAVALWVGARDEAEPPTLRAELDPVEATPAPEALVPSPAPAPSPNVPEASNPDPVVPESTVGGPSETVGPAVREATPEPRESAPAVERVPSAAPEPPAVAIPAADRAQEDTETLVVKLLTDDPNVVIYWIVDSEEGE